MVSWCYWLDPNPSQAPLEGVHMLGGGVSEVLGLFRQRWRRR